MAAKHESDEARHDWRKTIARSDLARNGVALVRICGKQVAVFETGQGIRACDNRCPHEGYPLAEGSLSTDCILTCNWHNWKFDLTDGRSLYGGDRLRIYPIELRGDDIWIDLADPPFAERYTAITTSLRGAFEDYSYDRVAREIARLGKLGADPLESLRLAIAWPWQKMEFGWTHAYAGMADWLELYDEHAGNAEVQLVCLVESVTHAAYDVQREPNYPFSENRARFDADAFVTVRHELEGVLPAMTRAATIDTPKIQKKPRVADNVTFGTFMNSIFSRRGPPFGSMAAERSKVQ